MARWVVGGFRVGVERARVIDWIKRCVCAAAAWCGAVAVCAAVCCVLCGEWSGEW